MRARLALTVRASVVAAAVAALALLPAGCGSSTRIVTVKTPATTATVTVTAPSSETAGSVSTPKPLKTESPMALLASERSGPPVPLGHTAAIGDGWTLRVESARSTAAGAQPAARLVTLSVVLGYRGTGEGVAPLEQGRLPYVEGEHHALYQWQSCGGNDSQPQGAIGEGIRMFSGAQQHAQLCFEVAVNDLSRLELHLGGEPADTSVGEGPASPSALPAMTFALR
jgi:hypothetical protein